MDDSDEGKMSLTPENELKLDPDTLKQVQSDANMFKPNQSMIYDIQPPADKGNTFVLGGGMGNSQADESASSTGNQKVAPYFSSLDPKNSSVTFNLALYNALG